MLFNDNTKIEKSWPEYEVFGLDIQPDLIWFLGIWVEGLYVSFHGVKPNWRGVQTVLTKG